MASAVRVSKTELPSLDALLAGSVTGLGFLSTDLRYIQANAALAATLGAASLIGLGPADLDATGGRTEVFLRRVLRTGRPITIGAGRRRVTYNRVLDADGAPLGLSAVSAPDSPVDLDLARWKLEAETDGLTGLVNHRVFQERLLSEVTRAQRYKRPLSLAMVDVDGFKQLNDAFGHQVGDEVLSTVARHLAASVRAHDTVARIGGDEFALLLPDTDAAAASVVAERVHDRLRRGKSHPGTTITLSTGLCDLEYASSADELIRFADGALFWTKGHGRNAICRYTPDLVEDLSAEQRGDRLLRIKALAGFRSLARAIDAKDHSTLLHSERVASLAGRLAEALDWKPDRVNTLREVALIHDVGKIGVPTEMLLKPGRLTASEYETVKTHAVLGAQIAGDVLDEEQIAWLRGHHENHDGSGYPDGIVGAVPDGAAIIRVADSWDVMTSVRSYSPAMTTTEAIAECQRCAGIEYHPAVVAALTSPGFERVLRMFANEQSTRDANEADLVDATHATFDIHCECGADDCTGMISIPASEYRAVRLADRRYIVKVGHEIPDIETTLTTTPTYLIVEKG
jgi:diguanylate cyclase (GGDEF)-like protein